MPGRPRALPAVAAALAAVAALAQGGAAAAAPLPEFRAVVRSISPAEREQMTPSVWRPGCPVGLSALRHVSLAFVGFDGRAHRGALVVHNGAARDVVTAFRALYGARVPIRRMRPIQAYGGDDFASIEADNTSAFNCRPATGSSRWSEHAYGRAIDINPIENPYVSGGTTSHRRSVPYLDRSRARPGMAVEGGALVRAFDAVGWGWGGRWSSIKDYQHFSVSGG
ncbi:MAG TPA: M15 family metallopeptidase [Miltoncostaeaceae bacterium]|nr:M15 family metallopeptidase [Miltoncostaeaceae bacterium]